MNLFLDYETFQSGWRRTHPLTINRIERMNSISGALDDPVIGTRAVQMFEQRLKTMQARSEWFHPGEPNLPPSLREKGRTDALFEALGSESDGLSAVEKLLDYYRIVS